jgi:excisionase family DNA binding protein
MNAKEEVTLYTIPVAAELMSCSRDHLYDLMTAGELTWVQTARQGSRSRRRIRHQDIVKFIRERTIVC